MENRRNQAIQNEIKQGVEAEDKALNATYSQALHDMLAHGMYVERDGVRVDPNDFFIERPESVEE